MARSNKIGCSHKREPKIIRGIVRRRAGAVGEEQILWEKSRYCGSGPCPRLIFEVAVLFAGMARSNKREPKIIRGIVRYLQLDNPLSITFCTDT